MGRPGADATDADWLGWREAVGVVVGRLDPLGTERVALDDALGRALAEDVRSEVDHPPWDNSAMDGYAGRTGAGRGATAEHPARLPLSDRIPAGGFPRGPLEPGTAAEVATGAPVPDGTEGVIRVEHTDGGEDGRVTIRRDDDARRNVRSAGEDVRKGDLVLETGREVTPGAVGMLAMTGRGEVEVGRRPRVGILSTGDELADVSEAAEARSGRRIMDSNGPALAAQLRATGAEALRLGVARDDPDAIRGRLAAASDCDVLVCTGGASVGERDHAEAVLAALGGERVFWRVRIRPGSPVLFGMLGDGRPFFGLPGNPVSAMVTCELLVRPAVRRLAGHAALVRRTVAARTRGEITKRPGLAYFYRVALERAPDGGPPRAALTGPQGSGILTSMAAADGLMVLPEGPERLEPGSPVEVLPLRGWTSREEDGG